MSDTTITNLVDRIQETTISIASTRACFGEFIDSIQGHAPTPPGTPHPSSAEVKPPRYSLAEVIGHLEVEAQRLRNEYNRVQTSLSGTQETVSQSRSGR